MKKLHLKFFGHGAKMVLPLFLLVGLFLINAQTASAQYVPEKEAVKLIIQYKGQLSTVVLPRAKDLMVTPEASDRAMDEARRAYGDYMIYTIKDLNYTVQKALNAAADMAEDRQLAEEVIDVIKQEYIDLLKA